MTWPLGHIYGVGPYLYLVMMTFLEVFKVPGLFCPRAVMMKCPSQNRNQRDSSANGGKIIGNQSPNSLIAVINLKQINCSAKSSVSSLANNDHENFVLFCLAIESQIEYYQSWVDDDRSLLPQIVAEIDLMVNWYEQLYCVKNLTNRLKKNKVQVQILIYLIRWVEFVLGCRQELTRSLVGQTFLCAPGKELLQFRPHTCLLWDKTKCVLIDKITVIFLLPLHPREHT